MVASMPRLESILFHTAKIRWGIWIDQYIIPFDGQNSPAVSEVTARAIFNFEPDNVVLSSEAVYQINRRWEHFVCVPRRLLDGKEPYGYRMTGHKRPSALDHAEAGHSTPFVGRERQLSIIEDCWRRRWADHQIGHYGCGRIGQDPLDQRVAQTALRDSRRSLPISACSEATWKILQANWRSFRLIDWIAVLW